ncbi:EamA-like transporter family protein [Enhygromyxa salina]|uniref:EamA-like transporter family protein n=2 Tax=Enhygromyxa salina TaxID=215803 RepID=A0A2S9XCT1_9BACT|nr:EamA-like transporter family protein [Enhygromyxa salina]
MLLATIAFAGMAAFVKVLREDGLTTSEVMFWRMAPGLVWVSIELRLRKQKLRPNAPWPVLLRSLAGLAAMSGYFYALRALTLIENAVLHLLQPVFVAVLAPLILGERLRRGAVLALLLALLGALVVVRPDLAWRANIPMLPLAAGAGAALCSALAHIMVRKSTARDSPELVVFWFTIAVSAAAVAVALGRGELAKLPAGLELGEAAWKITAMAGFGLAGQLLMTRAYGRAAAPLVAIVAYASIPASIVLDLAWGVRPGLDEALGSVLLVVAGALLVRGRSM